MSASHLDERDDLHSASSGGYRTTPDARAAATPAAEPWNVTSLAQAENLGNDDEAATPGGCLARSAHQRGPAAVPEAVRTARRFSICRKTRADESRRTHWYENCIKFVTRFGRSASDTTERPMCSLGTRSAWKRWEAPLSCVGSLLRSLSSPLCCWGLAYYGDAHHGSGGDPSSDPPGPRGLERARGIPSTRRLSPSSTPRTGSWKTCPPGSRPGGATRSLPALRGVMAGIAESRNEPVSGFRAGDMAVMEYEVTAVDAASGQEFTFRGALIAELEGDLIRHSREYYDVATILGQLGMLGMGEATPDATPAA